MALLVLMVKGILFTNTFLLRVQMEGWRLLIMVIVIQMFNAIFR